LLNIIPEDDDRVCGFERLDKASFALMSFRKVEAGKLCSIFPRGKAYASSNVERTTLQNQNNLLYLPGNEYLVRPAPPIPPSSYAEPSSSCHPS